MSRLVGETDLDRIRVQGACEVLAAAEGVDLTDLGALIDLVGRLQGAVEGLLAMLVEGGEPR